MLLEEGQRIKRATQGKERESQRLVLGEVERASQGRSDETAG